MKIGLGARLKYKKFEGNVKGFECAWAFGSNGGEQLMSEWNPCLTQKRDTSQTR